MKKYFYRLISLLIILLFSNIEIYAKDLKQIEYKNIKQDKKISCINGIWENKIDKKASSYLVKKISEEYPYFTEFYSPSGEFIFSPETHYEFIKDGRLFAYSNTELNLYEIINIENVFEKKALNEDEITELFPDFKAIYLTDFSIGTNSLKIKKNKKKLKLILINNLGANIEDFDFTSNNAKIKRYPLKGFIEIYKKGMIQFAPINYENKTNDWYILLVR